MIVSGSTIFISSEKRDLSDGRYKFYSNGTLVSEYNLKNGQLYGNCVYYSLNNIKYLCVIRNTCQSYVCINSCGDKLFSIKIVGDYRNIDNPKNFIDEKINNMDYITDIYESKSQRFVPMEKCISCFHYSNNKIRCREYNNVITLFYKNGYEKRFYKRKTILFY